MEYKKRIIDNILDEKLSSSGAILIQGPKWCGKTTSSKEKANSIVRMDDIDKKKENLFLAETNPRQLLKGKAPLLIDEWQLAPSLWDAVRFLVDEREEDGQFILTGSSVPIDRSEITHSGAGRFSYVKMRTMSLYESEDSSGSVSLRNLFTTPKTIEGYSDIDSNKLAYLICRGGWPRIVGKSEKVSLNESVNYLDAIIYDDINRVDGKIKDSNKVRKFFSSYARMQGSSASCTKISQDISEKDGDSINKETISSYIDALEKMFVIEECRAWNPNLRSKATIRTSATRYFSDPSIAVASLHICPEDLLNDLETFGFFLETLCIRDLRIYTDALSGDVYHYIDSDNLECDAVIHLRNGKYGLCEIKLGGERLINEGVVALNKLEKKIKTECMGSPSFKMVLTGVGSYGYRRKDGVYVVPIGSLRD